MRARTSYRGDGVGKGARRSREWLLPPVLLRGCSSGPLRAEGGQEVYNFRPILLVVLNVPEWSPVASGVEEEPERTSGDERPGEKHTRFEENVFAKQRVRCPVSVPP